MSKSLGNGMKPSEFFDGMPLGGRQAFLGLETLRILIAKSDFRSDVRIAAHDISKRLKMAGYHTSAHTLLIRK